MIVLYRKDSGCVVDLVDVCTRTESTIIVTKNERDYEYMDGDMILIKHVVSVPDVVKPIKFLFDGESFTQDFNYIEPVIE